MAYATVEDVENRIGYSVDEELETALEIFLEDASDSLDLELEERGVDPSTIEDSRLRRVVASHGVAFVQQWEINPYFKSHSQADDGASESMNFWDVVPARLYEFTRADLKRLGVKTFRFSKFTTEFEWGVQ